MKLDEMARLPTDTPLADELSSGDGIIEMANLDKSQTGIDGIIWMSTMMTGHAPASEIFRSAGTNAAQLFGDDRRSATGGREQPAAESPQPKVTIGHSMGHIKQRCTVGLLE